MYLALEENTGVTVTDINTWRLRSVRYSSKNKSRSKKTMWYKTGTVTKAVQELNAKIEALEGGKK